MEFKDKDTVYVETYEGGFEYDLSKKDSEVGLYSKEGHACILEQK